VQPQVRSTNPLLLVAVFELRGRLNIHYVVVFQRGRASRAPTIIPDDVCFIHSKRLFCRGDACAPAVNKQRIWSDVEFSNGFLVAEYNLRLGDTEKENSDDE